MKKTEFSALKKARRKTMKDTSMLKKLRSDDRETSKDIIQTITKKLVTEANSPWCGADLLYIIHTQKRSSKRVARDESTSTKSKEASSKSSTQNDRYIAMLRKKDSTQSISIVRLILKDDEIEIKNTFDLSALRAIDFGSDDNELLMSFDQADHNLYFSSQNERDETLWIIIQVCKHIVRNDITVGYSIDIDALTYITSTNGTLSRFPLLQKMVQQHTKELGDYFSKEETEAETLLDELDWGSSLHEHMNLQQTLSGQSDKLNDEIIDFLLQWEEMDLNIKNKVKSKEQAPPTKGGLTNTGRLAGVSDTSEVLQALGQVDLELEAVDIWLGEQIGRLEEVQANLHMIEDESGALESSWQSLRSVQEVVTLLVTRYSLNEIHEDILMHPEKVMNPILKSQTLNKVEDALSPLLDALRSVRNALKMKFNDIADISGPQWKQLQAMTCISSQRAKLNDVVDSCCDAFTDIALGLFDWLCKHKALQEAGTVVKLFSFTDVVSEDIRTGRSGKINFTTVPVWFTKIKSVQCNQLIKAKLVFESNLQPFLPILNLFVELAPKNLQPLQDAYLKAITEGLYKPLFKALAKDLLAQCSFKHIVVTLANVGKHKFKDKNAVLPLMFQKPAAATAAGTGSSAAASQQLSPWMAFRAALMLVIPLLEQEETFVATFLNLGGGLQALGGVTAERQQAYMSAIFDYIVSKFETAINVRVPSATPASSAATAGAAAGSSGVITGADGMSAVAMLAVLTDFEASYREAMIIQYSAPASAAPGTTGTLRTASSPPVPGPRTARFSDAPPSEAAAVPTARTDEEALNLYLDLYLASSMEATRVSLLSRVAVYASDQCVWLRQQKADAKSPDVLQPFAAFPTFVAQVTEMCNGKRFDCVDELLTRVCKELFAWLTTVANQNEKYADKIKITNLGYFLLVMAPLQLEVLESFVAAAMVQRSEATHRYINWMVQYEFPSLSALAIRLDGVGKKVNEEELSLYIRRKDVLNVVKEVEMKTLESMVSTMYKRLIKHFRSEFDVEMRLVETSWAQLRERAVNILGRLEEAASLSYQIKLEVGPKILGNMFDRVAGLVDKTSSSTDLSK